MAVTANWYRGAWLSAFNGEIDVDTHAMKIRLTDGTPYAPNQDTHRYLSSVTNEVGASGSYATGTSNLQLTNSVSLSGTTKVWGWDSDDPSWTSVTFTTRIAVYYDSNTGSDTTRPLVSWLDFGANQVLSTANFAITQDVAGIAKITATP